MTPASEAHATHRHRRAEAVLALKKGRDELGDVLGLLARRLTPAGEAFEALVTVLDLLYGSGVRSLGRLSFVGDELLALLRDEAHRQRPEKQPGRRSAPGQAGRVLARLAVSRQLRDAVSDAFGSAVTPTFDAVYQYDPPGSHVRTHVDTRDYELVVHLILDHVLPGDGSPGSALLVHLPGEPEPLRLPVAAGEAVALRGRSTIHSWEPLRDDEHRTMTATGFASGS
jgi:hypothetical protein